MTLCDSWRAVGPSDVNTCRVSRDDHLLYEHIFCKKHPRKGKCSFGYTFTDGMLLILDIEEYNDEQSREMVRLKLTSRNAENGQHLYIQMQLLSVTIILF